jgi:hypothetical protein
MAWVRLDDQFADHPKIAAAGPVAGWVYVSGLCYAARYLTDGFVPETIALRFAGSSPEILANLVECSLFDRVNGGYLIHDFLEYNPPASKVKAEREAAKARMQRKNAPKHGVSDEIQQKFGRNSGEIQPSPTPTPSPSESEREVRTPPPIDPFPEQGPEYREALRKLDAQWPGGVTGSVQLKLTRIWDQLTNGKASWLDDAIIETVARGGHTPDYALQVLATALRSNKRPGYSQASTARPSRPERDLNALLGITNGNS